MKDTIVVGAGPAGTLAARSMAEKGYDVLVLENHQVAGLPQHCTGLISPETLEMSRVNPDILNTISNAEFVFPNGRSFTVNSKTKKAVIVDRADLDQKMADAAQDAGAVFSYSTRYDSHTVKDAVFVDSDRATFKARSIVGADGASSKVAMTLGDNKPREYVRGIQADVAYRMENQDTMKIFIGNSVAPGFFLWQIPCGDFTRIGLCTSWNAGSPSEYLTQKLISMNLHDKVQKVYSGKIPLGGRQFVSGDRCLLTGDAAGFVKPMSGGGLYPAFKANQHLVSVLSSCLDAETMASKDMAEYSRRCDEDFGRELDHDYKFRRRYKKMTDRDFNRIYKYVIMNNLAPRLEEIDIDHPLSVVRSAIYGPKVIISGIPIMLRMLI